MYVFMYVCMYVCMHCLFFYLFIYLYFIFLYILKICDSFIVLQISSPLELHINSFKDIVNSTN